MGHAAVFECWSQRGANSHILKITEVIVSNLKNTMVYVYFILLCLSSDSRWFEFM